MDRDPEQRLRVDIPETDLPSRPTKNVDSKFRNKSKKATSGIKIRPPQENGSSGFFYASNPSGLAT